MSNLATIEEQLKQQFNASLGTPVSTIVDAISAWVTELSDKDDVKRTKAKICLMGCVTAAIGVRETLAKSGADRILSEKPAFAITGTREVRDTLNFSAVRMAGHIIIANSSHAMAAKLTAKAGNMASGSGFTETKAGKINRETFMGLSASDKASLTEFAESVDDSKRAKLNSVFTALTGV